MQERWKWQVCNQRLQLGSSAFHSILGYRNAHRPLNDEVKLVASFSVPHDLFSCWKELINHLLQQFDQLLIVYTHIFKILIQCIRSLLFVGVPIGLLLFCLFAFFDVFKLKFGFFIVSQSNGYSQEFDEAFLFVKLFLLPLCHFSSSIWRKRYITSSSQTLGRAERQKIVVQLNLFSSAHSCRPLLCMLVVLWSLFYWLAVASPSPSLPRTFIIYRSSRLHPHTPSLPGHLNPLPLLLTQPIFRRHLPRLLGSLILFFNTI